MRLAPFLFGDDLAILPAQALPGNRCRPDDQRQAVHAMAGYFSFSFAADSISLMRLSWLTSLAPGS